MKAKYENWLSRWRLRRIIAALSYATEFGLKKEVSEFARAMEATSLMARGTKKDQELVLTCKREELDCFITYIVRLHSSKLSLWHRARIGLATLALRDKYVLGETPLEFVQREFPKAKSSADDKLIKLVK